MAAEVPASSAAPGGGGLADQGLLIIAALVFIGLVVLYFFKKLVVPDKGTAILLVGPCGAGKTCMFYQLRDGSTHSGTITSMKENDDTFGLHAEEGTPGGPVHVVDLPGHPRLRLLTDDFLPSARGVVFVVDSVDFMPQASAMAEQLYDVLAHPSMGKHKTPVLLACNKADKVTAHSVDFIRKRFEREIDQLRQTRGSLQDSGGGSSKDRFLGAQGETFKFSQLPNPVTAESVSVLRGKLQPVHSFIRLLVK